VCLDAASSSRAALPSRFRDLRSEIPFLLNEHGVHADLAKLNVAFDGGTGALALKPSMDAPHVITQCAMRETPSFLVSVSRTAASSRNPL